MFTLLNKEVEELRKSNLSPIEFAIRAIQINITAWAFKDEKILQEAMLKLQELNGRKNDLEPRNL